MFRSIWSTIASSASNTGGRTLNEKTDLLSIIYRDRNHVLTTYLGDNCKLHCHCSHLCKGFEPVEVSDNMFKRATITDNVAAFSMVREHIGLVVKTVCNGLV